MTIDPNDEIYKRKARKGVVERELNELLAEAAGCDATWKDELAKTESLIVEAQGNLAAATGSMKDILQRAIEQLESNRAFKEHQIADEAEKYSARAADLQAELDIINSQLAGA